MRNLFSFLNLNGKMFAFTQRKHGTKEQKYCIQETTCLTANLTYVLML